MRVEMAWRDRERRLSLRLAHGTRMRAPASRAIEVRVAGERKTRLVRFDGRPVEVAI